MAKDTLATTSASLCLITLGLLANFPPNSRYHFIERPKLPTVIRASPISAYRGQPLHKPTIQRKSTLKYYKYVIHIKSLWLPPHLHRNKFKSWTVILQINYTRLSQWPWHKNLARHELFIQHISGNCKAKPSIPWKDSIPWYKITIYILFLFLFIHCSIWNKKSKKARDRRIWASIKWQPIISRSWRICHDW